MVLQQSMLTPTEALLHVAKTNPFLAAIRCNGTQWSYATLWARIRQLSNEIDRLDPGGNPVGLYMNLEVDYVAGAHAIWLSGRTVVFLSTKWTREVLEQVLARSFVSLVLYGEAVPPLFSQVFAVSTLRLMDTPSAQAYFPAPIPSEVVGRIPVVCSITPTSGSTGVPKSIVYPMKRSLSVLMEESTTLLKPRDGQWLRGGTTFLRPLFEIRRFMYTQTTLYLDSSSSISDQCAALCAELESTRNIQPLRVHFTPSVFRAFADYVRHRFGERARGASNSGFWRVYWMVIGGENLSIRDLELARLIFPECTIACNYACSEVGFAGVSQMFIRPTDPIPSVISYGPSQGCTDLVLLDNNLRPIARGQAGVTGIVGIISDQSAVAYLNNNEATSHMFRRWHGNNILLYTDDLGSMTKEGRIIVNGRQSRNVKINGLFVDLDYLERALGPGFNNNLESTANSPKVTAFKLVKSNDEKIILFYTATASVQPRDVLKRARDTLRSSLGDALAMVIHSVRGLDEMPFNASYKVDLAKLQRWADSLPPSAEKSLRFAPPGLPHVITDDISKSSPPVDSSTDASHPLNKSRDIALEIAAEVKKLCRSEEPVPTDVALMYAGLNSITVVQLHFWLQAEYDYEDDMSRLFEEDATAEVLAQEIIGDDDSEDEGEDEEDEDGDGDEDEDEDEDGDELEDEPLTPAAETPEAADMNYFPNVTNGVLTFSRDWKRAADEDTVVPDTASFVSDDPKFQSSGIRREPVSVIVMRPPEELSIAKSKEPRISFGYGPLSFLFLTWLTPLMRLGAKRPLQASDLFPLRRNDGAAVVELWADKFWNDLRDFYSGAMKKMPSLFKSIFGSATFLWLISGWLWLLSTSATVAGPLFIQQIIVAAAAPPRPSGPPAAVAQYDQAILDKTGGTPLFFHSTYALAGIMLGLKITYTLCGRACDQIVRRLGLNIKTVLIASVYKKALKLSAKGSQKYSRGYILNLVNVDCESISKAVELAHQTWSIPYQIATTVFLLSRILGVSVWAGVGALGGAVIMLILTVPIFMRKSSPQFLKLGDQRLKVVREIMDGIKIVKINAWEKAFQNKLEAIRTEQLGWLKRFNIGVTCFVVVGQLANTIMPLAAFSLFGHEKRTVNAARVFPAISFFAMLVDPLIALPQLLSALVIAMTSWGRVYAFLMADEKTPVSDVLSTFSDDHITITNGAFVWPDKGDDSPADPETKEKVASKSREASAEAEFEGNPGDFVNETKKGDPEAGYVNTRVELPFADPAPEEAATVKPLLSNINISIEMGSLTAIVGSVGSGKSSLLSGIIGEMMCVEGNVACRGSVAYCAQQPWIQTSTLQENILFGQPLSVRRLEEAITTTAFKSDLEQFPHGMSTEIGEKGINLSGGQKARLALARAVYSDSDIYLLDDPLSALDARVGRYVFEKCIKEGLCHKTRVLVTHQLQYLSQVDHIIVIADGSIAEQGSYTELVGRGGELSRLLNDIQSFTHGKSEDSSNNLTRKDTVKSISKGPEEKPQAEDVFIVQEERATGSITRATWWAYIKASGGAPMILALLAEILLFQTGTIFINQWLTWWTSDQFHEQINWWIVIYNAIGWGAAFLLTVLNITILFGSLCVSRNFHARALASVINAPMWWFESQPIGRIMNRFSKDIEALDQRLMPQVFQLVAGAGALLAITVILAYSVPLILTLLFPLMGVYLLVLRFYRKSLRELKRLEATERSPLQARISETLDGIPTIMAYKRERDFENAISGLLDKSNQPTFLRFSAEIWITIRMEVLSSFVLFTLAMLAHTKAVGSLTQFALAITYASSLTYIMNLLLKSAANVESEMNAVERLLEYSTTLPQEPPAYVGADPLPEFWPSRGEIVLRNLTASYHSRPDKPVLRNLNLVFQPGETIYIVGRTGSGKSTLLSVLLRLIEISEGRVVIDGQDISSLGLATLRKAMQLIPQDPFLFSGTIRTSLDFDSSFDDEVVWHALELVGLKEFVSQQDQKLDTPVTQNGANYSVGQRQLLCLAGAILRQPKILLLDEATASIDVGSDVHIQQTMRANCPNATILSVMHRLGDRIIEECDRVLVMDQGVAVEFASPRELLARPGSMFGRLMDAAKTHS